jgi:hypothetical protein
VQGQYRVSARSARVSTRTTPGAMRAAREPSRSRLRRGARCARCMRGKPLCCAGLGYCADGHDAHSHRAMPSHADRWIDPPRTQGTAVYSGTRSTLSSRGTHADRWIDRRVQDARASSHAATCARSRRRSRPLQPYLTLVSHWSAGTAVACG